MKAILEELKEVLNRYEGKNRFGFTAEGYLDKLKRKVATRADLQWEKRAELYYGKPYDFVRIASKGLLSKPNVPVVLIRAGIHGEEVAGPITILHHLNSIADLAAQRGLHLVIYPLANPSGFETGSRYNAAHKPKKGDDFVRYSDDDYAGSRDHDSTDTKARPRLTVDVAKEKEVSKETWALSKDLKTLPINQIRAVIDLHQDYWMPKRYDRPSAYFYVFGDRRRYLQLSNAVSALLPIHSGPAYSGETVDREGFVVSRDGSFADAMRVLGAEHSIVVETNGKTPLEIAEKVNMIWISGIMKML